MITITNSSIILPQGETAVVSFGFKDIKTNSPLILANQNVKHYIHVVVKDHLSNTGEAILAKYLQITNSDDYTGWHIFKDNKLEIVELVNDDLLLGDATDSINQNITEPEVLHKIVCKSFKNETMWTVYAYEDSDGELHYYDYQDSSITIVFGRNDTKDLQPKTYYLEIYHETRDDNDLEITKHTLLQPIDFVIKGALA